MWSIHLVIFAAVKKSEAVLHLQFPDYLTSVARQTSSAWNYILFNATAHFGEPGVGPGDHEP